SPPVADRSLSSHMPRRPPRSPPFPYTTLFRSAASGASLAASLPGAPRCAVFPASNPWNEQVDALPRADDSGVIVASIGAGGHLRSEEHTSELQSLTNLVCRLLLAKQKPTTRVV